MLAYSVFVPPNTTYDLFQGHDVSGRNEIHISNYQTPFALGSESIADCLDGFQPIATTSVIYTDNEGLWARTDAAQVEISVLINKV